MTARRRRCSPTASGGVWRSSSSASGRRGGRYTIGYGAGSWKRRRLDRVVPGHRRGRRSSGTSSTSRSSPSTTRPTTGARCEAARPAEHLSRITTTSPDGNVTVGAGQTELFIDGALPPLRLHELTVTAARRRSPTRPPGSATGCRPSIPTSTDVDGHRGRAPRPRRVPRDVADRRAGDPRRRRRGRRGSSVRRDHDGRLGRPGAAHGRVRGLPAAVGHAPCPWPGALVRGRPGLAARRAAGLRPHQGRRPLAAARSSPAPTRPTTSAASRRAKEHLDKLALVHTSTGRRSASTSCSRCPTVRPTSSPTSSGSSWTAWPTSRSSRARCSPRALDWLAGHRAARPVRDALQGHQRPRGGDLAGRPDRGHVRLGAGLPRRAGLRPGPGAGDGARPSSATAARVWGLAEALALLRAAARGIPVTFERVAYYRRFYALPMFVFTHHAGYARPPATATAWPASRGRRPRCSTRPSCGSPPPVASPRAATDDAARRRRRAGLRHRHVRARTSRPDVDDEYAASLCLTVGQLLRSVRVRVAHEGEALFDDNASSRALLDRAPTPRDLRMSSRSARRRAGAGRSADGLPVGGPPAGRGRWAAGRARRLHRGPPRPRRTRPRAAIRGYLTTSSNVRRPGSSTPSTGRAASDEETIVPDHPYVTEEMQRQFWEDGVVPAAPGPRPDVDGPRRARHQAQPAQPRARTSSTTTRGTPRAFIDDYCNYAAVPEYQMLVEHSPIVDVVATVLGTENLWLFYDQIFIKDAPDGRGPPHAVAPGHHLLDHGRHAAGRLLDHARRHARRGVAGVRARLAPRSDLRRHRVRLRRRDDAVPARRRLPAHPRHRGRPRQLRHRLVPDHPGRRRAVPSRACCTAAARPPAAGPGARCRCASSATTWSTRTRPRPAPRYPGISALAASRASRCAARGSRRCTRGPAPDRDARRSRPGLVELPVVRQLAKPGSHRRGEAIGLLRRRRTTGTLGSRREGLEGLLDLVEDGLVGLGRTTAVGREAGGGDGLGHVVAGDDRACGSRPSRSGAAPRCGRRSPGTGASSTSSSHGLTYRSNMLMPSSQNSVVELGRRRAPARASAWRSCRTPSRRRCVGSYRPAGRRRVEDRRADRLQRRGRRRRSARRRRPSAGASDGHLEGRAHALGHEPVDDERGVRRRVHQGVEVAGVVDVVVADEHPADVLGLDEAEHVGEVLLRGSRPCRCRRRPARRPGSPSS